MYVNREDKQTTQFTGTGKQTITYIVRKNTRKLAIVGIPINILL